MKVIALDLDGTLLTSQDEISQNNRAAIAAAQQQGQQVAVASGRAYVEAAAIMANVGLSVHVISANGAAVHNQAGEQLAEFSIEAALSEELLQWLEDRAYYYEFVAEDHETYTLAAARQRVEEALTTRVQQGLTAEQDGTMLEMKKILRPILVCAGWQEVVRQVRLGGCYKIFAFAPDRAKIDAAFAAFAHYEELALVSSNNHNIEINHKDASKGRGLTELAAHLSVPLVDTIAIGDNDNDLSMFAVAGLSIAMGNAKAHVQQHCQQVTLGNDEDGVAHALKTWG